MEQPRPRKGCFGTVVRVIVSTVLGALAGIVLSRPVNAGVLERWHGWEASAPQGAVELLLEAQGGLCARTVDNEVYAYNSDEKSWDQTECVPAEPGHKGMAAIYKYDNPCRAEWPAFWFLANSPRSMVHCIDYSRVYMETNWTTYYALDDSGQIWRWSHRLYVYDAFRCALAVTMVGGIVGLVVGIFWARRWRRRDWSPDHTEQD